MVVIQYTRENYCQEKSLLKLHSTHYSLASTCSPLAFINMLLILFEMMLPLLLHFVTFMGRNIHLLLIYLDTHFSKRTVNCCKRVDILLHKLRIQSQLYTLKERRKIFPRIYQKENLLHRSLWETLPVVILY